MLQEVAESHTAQRGGKDHMSENDRNFPSGEGGLSLWSWAWVWDRRPGWIRTLYSIPLRRIQVSGHLLGTKAPEDLSDWLYPSSVVVPPQEGWYFTTCSKGRSISTSFLWPFLGETHQ